MDIRNEVITKKDFLTCIKEAKSISIVEKKEFTRANKSSILRNRLVQLYLMGSYSNRQISDILGVNYQTVGRMLKEPKVKDMLENYTSEENEIINAKLKALRDRATDTLSDLLNSDEDNVRLQTAKVILDKTGHGDKREVEQTVNVSYEQRLTQVLEGVSFDVDKLVYEVEEK